LQLIHEKNKRLILLKSEDLDHVSNQAISMAKELDLKVFDASEGKGKWMELPS